MGYCSLFIPHSISWCCGEPPQNFQHRPRQRGIAPWAFPTSWEAPAIALARRGGAWRTRQAMWTPCLGLSQLEQHLPLPLILADHMCTMRVKFWGLHFPPEAPGEPPPSCQVTYETCTVEASLGYTPAGIRIKVSERQKAMTRGRMSRNVTKWMAEGWPQRESSLYFCIFCSSMPIMPIMM